MSILSNPDAAAWADAQRLNGRRVVFTNGVFDLLHPGHVRYLQAARREGDALIVGVNSDRSVRAIKGPSTRVASSARSGQAPASGPERPIIPEQERAEILDALACVDAVTIFDQDTPAEIIRLVQPDVLVKGADWAADQIVGRDTVEARGGRVVRMKVEEGWSTTNIIAAIQKNR